MIPKARLSKTYSGKMFPPNEFYLMNASAGFGEKYSHRIVDSIISHRTSFRIIIQGRRRFGENGNSFESHCSKETGAEMISTGFGPSEPPVLSVKTPQFHH